jgi:DNA-binding transcriptional MerR regulator
MATPLRTSEAAREIGVAPSTLRDWRCRGVGPPFVRAGKIALYDKGDLKRWQDRHRVDPEGVRREAAR